MSDFYIGDLTPGTFVVNVSKEKEWGIGQVQSCINNIVTINFENVGKKTINPKDCLLYTYPSPRDLDLSRMPSSA